MSIVLGMLTNYLQSRQAFLVSVPAPEKPVRPNPRRPHPPKTLDAIRELYETTALSLRAIAARTGASAATISRQARAGGWMRPDTGFAVEHYSPEGRRVLRRRALAERLLAQAEHELFQVEMNPTTKRRALEHAMRLVRAARALDQQERPKRTRRKRKVQSQEPLR
jgi:hypothetical protein